MTTFNPVGLAPRNCAIGGNHLHGKIRAQIAARLTFEQTQWLIEQSRKFDISGAEVIRRAIDAQMAVRK